MRTVWKMAWAVPLFASLCAVAQTLPGPTAPAAPAAPLDAAGWERLVRDLGADDFAVRQEAQQRLDELSYKQREALNKRVGETTDPEAQARLAARLQAIDEALAVNPPAITVHLKDAPIAEVAAALSAQMGIVFESSASDKSLRFTLDAVEMPYCQVIQALCRQHPLSYEAGSRGPKLRDGGTYAMRDLQVHEGFAVAALSISRRSSVDPQRQPPNQVTAPATRIEVQVLADPRIQVDSLSDRLFFRITDDKGNGLIDLKQLAADEKQKNSTSANNAWRKSMTLTVPEVAGGVGGTKIARAQGLLTFGVMLTGQNARFDDAEKHVGEAITFGRYTITLTKFTVTDKQVAFSLTAPQPASAQPERPQVRLLDANGMLLWKGTLAGTTSGTAPVPFNEPLRVEVSLPEKSRDVEVTYEFKDLPLP